MLIPTSSTITDFSFENPAWKPQDLTSVGENRYVAQRRNTKITFEGISNIQSPHEARAPSSDDLHHPSAEEHYNAISWLLSGLYAMLVIDIGLVMKVSQLIAVDITAVEFHWFFIIIYAIGIIWLVAYFPLMTTCYKHKEIMKTKSNQPENRWLTGLLLLFGLAIIIKDGLAFVAFLVTDPSSCPARSLYAARPVCNAVFLLTQVSYIFRHAKYFTPKFQVLTRFGIMHVVAINLSIWFSLVIDESAAAIQHQSEPPSDVTTAFAATTTGWQDPDANSSMISIFAGEDSHHTAMLFPEDCHCDSSFCSIVALAQAFLFPFVIEFSLVASCLLYLTWKNVGKVPKLCQYVIKPSFKLYKSYKGVILGCLVLLATILVIVMLGTAVASPSGDGVNTHSDVGFLYIYNIFYIVLELFMMLSAAFGFYLFKKIEQDTKEEAEHLDDVLLIACLVGPLFYGMFSMFGIALSNLEARDTLWALSFVLPLFDILQCMSQVVLLLVGLHRKPIISPEDQKAAEEIKRRVIGTASSNGIIRSGCRNGSTSGMQSTHQIHRSEAASDGHETQLSAVEQSSMPRALVPDAGSQIDVRQDGALTVKVVTEMRITPPDRRRRLLRDVLIFLLFSNASLWVFLSLEGTAFDVKFYQDAYYGSELWTIISMICRPLNIFFRMHSAACFFEMWSFA